MNASHTPPHQLDIAAISLEDLARIRTFVRESLEADNAGETADTAVLVVDEICANLVMHGFAEREPGRVLLGVGATPDAVRIVIEDGGRPFHPLSAPQPDLESDWTTRQVGGLGWFFVRQLMDECTYEAGEGLNRLTLVKRRELPLPETGNTTVSGEHRE